jgi:endo-1,4-beta-xylanase
MPHPTFGAPTTHPDVLRNRVADTTVTLHGTDGPLGDRDVVLAQRDHAFLFGCTGFEFVPLATGELTEQAQERSQAGPGGVVERYTLPARADAERLADLWFGVFNLVTLPFYWGRFEPERGRPDTARMLAAARWFADRGVPVKGHPLAWHTVTAEWLLDLPSEEVARAQVDRIRREVSDFAGVVGLWDVVNEAVIMPVFDRGDNGITRLCREIGRIPFVRMTFDAAREADPHATLLLNDFDLSTAFECLIEGVLEAGVRIDAIGLQTHMHQGYWGEERTLAVLDRFARYGLPLHLTETTLVSGHLMPPEIEDLNDYQVDSWPTTPDGEQRQAEELARHVTTLVSHPAVAAMTYWGLTDGGWLGAPGGLLRVDGSVKPSYRALHGLVKGEWWVAPTTLRTDADGRLAFRGFPGRYGVTVDGAEAEFVVDRPGDVAVDAVVGQGLPA